MELKSDPQYADVQVTDIDIQFPGDLQTHTLYAGKDTLTNDGNQMVITFGTEGKMVFNLQHAHWYAQRERTQRVPVPQTGE